MVRGSFVKGTFFVGTNLSESEDGVMKDVKKRLTCPRLGTLSPLGYEPCDSWSLSHLGNLYPGTSPVMIKLDYNRRCPWV